MPISKTQYQFKMLNQILMTINKHPFKNSVKKTPQSPCKFSCQKFIIRTDGIKKRIKVKQSFHCIHFVSNLLVQIYRNRIIKGSINSTMVIFLKLLSAYFGMVS